MTLSIKTTQDGSTTLYNKKLDEHYHSIFGAIQEAKHIYIDAGFHFMNATQSRILEIGFGTGLNALLTQEATESIRKKIYYCSIEKFVLNTDIVQQLDFGIERKEKIKQLHQLQWNETHLFSSHFTIKKIRTDLHLHQFEEKFDLIYYDAFAPDKQPDMWEEVLLEKVINCLEKGGILVTYSTKGIVKQRLRKLGMEVKRLKGPKGKKDMLRCIKSDIK